MKLIALAAVGLAAVSQAQAQCVENLLIDDFISANRPLTGPAGNDRIYDLLGGDYGGVGIQGNITIDNKGNGTIFPDNSMAGLNGTNYFFLKFDPNACFNATLYTGLQMSFVFPAGSDFQIAFTQKAPNCVDRLTDSIYKKLSDYIIPNGSHQSVFIPFADFGQNVAGGAYDWQHIKDLTFLQFMPTRMPYTFNKLVLLSKCSGTTIANGTTTQPTTEVTKTASDSVKVAGSIGTAMMALAAIVASFF
ncbi:hypothetical protein SmJEL517_g03592 [Synchytrium microbalum]|uniref:Uncharacterized protein n=1 Tax=Synchytrium microbalum TaxID=1806994 RepID=A0A507C1D8_9FUNG|nr:uncharacterized protein SmJEL517_g03592 [Synchytrium microbalum]TPX33512.1 hypothetical protein SmJEL517_g03592 [Synchytrium microbalum]